MAGMRPPRTPPLQLTVTRHRQRGMAHLRRAMRLLHVRRMAVPARLIIMGPRRTEAARLDEKRRSAVQKSTVVY